MNLRVLIVAEHASAKFGGEAALPLHYYRILRQRGIPTWLVVHKRTQSELRELFPHDRNIAYIPDTNWHRFLWKIGSLMPNRLAHFTTGFVMRLITQLTQRRIMRQLIRDEKINVIHQPIPVSPKEPSMIFGMGIPVVIGPMNGGMDYPPAFRRMENLVEKLLIGIGRKFSNLMNTLIPGKQQAALLLVANERTRQALPQGVGKKVMKLVENGVDFSLWKAAVSPLPKPHPAVTHYVFVGRLVDWKAVDLLLLAFSQAASQSAISLTIIGDGEERQHLEKQAEELHLLTTHPHQPGRVFFAGWLSQPECAAQLQQFDALVLPSLRECGGAVVLEAMAKGLPIIATNWGGPADYLDSSCGILVEPSSHEMFVADLAQAMQRMARSPQERQAMGRAGQEKVRQFFDWEVKVDCMMDIYQQVVETHSVAKPPLVAPALADHSMV